jgi:hypothetical protein
MKENSTSINNNLKSFWIAMGGKEELPTIIARLCSPSLMTWELSTHTLNIQGDIPAGMEKQPVQLCTGSVQIKFLFC